MSRDIEKINVNSLQEALNCVEDVAELYRNRGLLVLKGHQFSTEDQVTFVKALGDILNWNINSDATEMAVNSSIYLGGHSDNAEKEYNQTEKEYVLDWHIEQVYYIYPILAGVWSMTDFTAEKGRGNTRFVDSIEILEGFSQEDQEFLAKSVVTWDKDAPSGNGPYYTKAVDFHPISGKPTLRVETDQGCKSFPELYAWGGEKASQEQKEHFSSLQESLKNTLNTDEDIRYSQEWEEGDLLIVDLFRMYHSVMGGFSFGERKFTGIGLRPKVYDNSLYTDLGLL